MTNANDRLPRHERERLIALGREVRELHAILPGLAACHARPETEATRAN